MYDLSEIVDWTKLSNVAKALSNDKLSSLDLDKMLNRFSSNAADWENPGLTKAEALLYELLVNSIRHYHMASLPGPRKNISDARKQVKKHIDKAAKEFKLNNDIGSPSVNRKIEYHLAALDAYLTLEIDSQTCGRGRPKRQDGPYIMSMVFALEKLEQYGIKAATDDGPCFRFMYTYFTEYHNFQSDQLSAHGTHEDKESVFKGYLKKAVAHYRASKQINI